MYPSENFQALETRSSIWVAEVEDEANSIEFDCNFLLEDNVYLSEYAKEGTEYI